MKEKLRTLRNQIEREKHSVVLSNTGLPDPYDDICRLYDRVRDLCVHCEELAGRLEPSRVDLSQKVDEKTRANLWCP
jgi:hypothetical protein